MPLFAVAAAATTFVSIKGGDGSFPLVANGEATPLFLSAEVPAGVLKVAGQLQADILKVTG